MNSIKTCTTTASQSSIVMPTFIPSTYAFGDAARGRVDATTVKHVALFEGAPIGTSVWSPPSR